LGLGLVSVDVADLDRFDFVRHGGEDVEGCGASTGSHEGLYMVSGASARSRWPQALQAIRKGAPTAWTTGPRYLEFAVFSAAKMSASEEVCKCEIQLGRSLDRRCSMLMAICALRGTTCKSRGKWS
jgi:hypothetical protein